MKGSIKLGRYAGIDVYLHVTFLAFLVFIGATELIGGSWSSAVSAVVFFCSVFGCVLLHEFGHALAARQFGIGTRDITLLPIGGVARLERMPEKPLQELWISLAGPAVNVVIILILGLWIAGTGQRFQPSVLDLTRGDLVHRLLVVNLTLVIFNMIPAFPMDGGRVLRALLATMMNHATATRIAATLGQGVALIFAVFGLMAMFGGGGNPFLIFIALFVWIGAKQEAAAAEFRACRERAVPPILMVIDSRRHAPGSLPPRLPPLLRP